MTPTLTQDTNPSGKLTSQAATDFSGIHADIRLGGDEPMTVIAMTIAHGLGAPAHISFSEDKVFVITAGRLVFLVGADTFEAAAGDHIHVGRGVTHSFSAIDDCACMTLVSTPARHDRFFLALGALPEPHRPEDIDAVCARFDQAIVGPIVLPRPA